MIYLDGKVLNTDSTLYSGQLLDTWPTGRTKLVAQVNNGLIHGNSKEFYESGQVHFIRNYKDGQLCCVITEYFLNGELKMQGVIGPQAMCGGNMIANMLYAYYSPEGKYVNKVKARARIVFFTHDKLSSFFNGHLPIHMQAGYRIFDTNKADFGMFIEDSRKITAPVSE